MIEELISFETAKLAKEKGFDLPCQHYWGIDSDGKTKTCREFGLYKEYYVTSILLKSNKNLPFKTESPYSIEQLYTAPTQSLLQKWLRYKHGYHVEVPYIKNEKSYYVTIEGFRNSIRYKTYEEALEKGLQEALKLIK